MNKLRKIGFIILLITLLSISGLTRVGAEELTITGNGAGAQSEISVTAQNTTTIEQAGQTQTDNNIQTSANTGDSKTSDNTGGTTNITTGDTSSNTTVENQANISSVNNQCCPTPGTTAIISDNGANSQNSINVSSTTQTNVTIDQKADIKNEVSGQANTGGNTASNNGGSTTISTGNITVQGDIINHNINITQVTTGQGNPESSIKISGNGAGSENNVSASQDNEIAVQIDNVANIDNQINWELSTGNNFGSGNLGDVAIFTGDINFNLNIENGPINLSEVIISCCEVTPSPSPSPTPSPTPTPTPQPTSTPNPTPTPSPSGGESSSSSSSSGGGEAAAGGPGEILAATTGEVLAATGNNWLIFLTLLGILTLVSGLYLRFGPKPRKVTIKCI